MISPLLDAQAILSEGLRYVPLDASVLLPGQKGDPDKAFAEARMVGARRFDIDVFSDPESAYPHTVPGVARFCALMGALGLTEDTPILFMISAVVREHAVAGGWPDFLATATFVFLTVA